MKNVAKLTLCAVAILCLAPLRTAAAEPRTGPGSGPVVIEPELRDRIREEGRLPVLVRLRAEWAETGESEVGSNPASPGSRALRAVQSAVLERMSHHEVEPAKLFSHVPWLAVEIDEPALLQLALDPDVTDIREDFKNSPSLATSVPQIEAGATEVYDITGVGRVVAILDTGVDKNHLFLNEGKVVSEACYSTTGGGLRSTCPNGASSAIGPGVGLPCNFGGCDHGTHVAGIAAGVDSTVAFHGVAPRAGIIAIKVFGRSDTCEDDNGTLFTCPLAHDSDVIKGLERVYDLRDSFKIGAVNLSLGQGNHGGHCDSGPYKDIVDKLRAAGIPTVASSGNEGLTGGIGSPACVSSVVSVGAVDSADDVWALSNSSPVLDLLAPGVLIRSSVPNNQFDWKSGTSMAAPHVAGALTLMSAAAPTASVTTRVDTLRRTGTSVTDTKNGIAVPRINVHAAIASVTSTLPWTEMSFNGHGWYVGDFNGDGAEDIFRQTTQYGGAQVFLSNGHNSFNYEGVWLGAGHNGYGWHIGDFNGDGRDDVFRQVNQYGGAEVYLSNGRNAFTYVGRWTGAGHNGYGWHVGDFNGDGADDIFRQANRYGGAEVYLSNRSSQFVPKGSWTGAGHNGYGWYIGDFNGDGADDIFRQVNQYGGADVYLSNRSSQFIPKGTWSGYGHNGSGWYIGDFDGDGDDDILRRVNQWGGAEVLLSNRTSGFAYTGAWTGAGDNGYGWYVGDFDGDGDDDIFRQMNQYGGAEVALSSGNGRQFDSTLP